MFNAYGTLGAPTHPIGAASPPPPQAVPAALRSPAFQRLGSPLGVTLVVLGLAVVLPFLGREFGKLK